MGVRERHESASNVQAHEATDLAIRSSRCCCRAPPCAVAPEYTKDNAAQLCLQ